jgi:uroporphyrin-III C-methyltransferase / precorrin-2 dehydrogenase / sirohydrochlorin ferrochelatase
VDAYARRHALLRWEDVMQHLAVFLVARGRAALVLGAGPTADRKAALLERAGAEVRREAVFDPLLLEGCAVAIGADAPDAELEALSQEAMARGIPVNIVDRPALCSFIMPAIVDREPVTIAVGTGGAAPVLARLIRARIEAVIPPRIGRVAAVVSGFTEEMRARFPELSERRRLIERMFGGRVAALALAGDEDAAREAVAAEIEAAATGGRAPGIVHFVGAGPGEADLVTLRGQRLLGEADVVVHDEGASAAVLDLARRDAERVVLAGPDAALLIALAREGKMVVRVLAGAAEDGGPEAAAVAAAGADVAVVPGIAGAG